MSGLAVIVATGDLIYLRRQRLLRTVWAAALVAPALVGDRDHAVPALDRQRRSADLAAGAARSRSFFGDSFERRTNQRLRAVAGDPQLASFIALDRGRPHLLLDATPERTPWLTVAKFNETGGVVVWRASDTVRHAAARYRAAVSRPGAGSAARLRMAGERPPAAAADRLGHRAAEGAVAMWHRRVGKAKRAHHLEAIVIDGGHVAARLCPRDAALRMRTASAPAPSRSRADPATTSACRTASATDRPDGTSPWRGWCGCRCRSRTICRGSS